MSSIDDDDDDDNEYIIHGQLLDPIQEGELIEKIVYIKKQIFCNNNI